MTCSCSSTPTPRPAPGFGEAIPPRRTTAAAGRRGWGWSRRRAGGSSTRAAASCTSPASRGPDRRAAGARVARAARWPFLSGACLAIPRAEWQRVGGFAERYFMYLEDVDLSLRLRLAGRAHRRRAGGGRRPRLHVHQGRRRSGGCSSATAGRPLVRCYPASLLARARARAAGDRARAAGRRGGRRLAAAEARAARAEAMRRAAAAAARAARDAGDPHASPPPSSLPRSRPTSTRVYLGARGAVALLRVLLRAYWRGALWIVRQTGR